MRSGIKKLAKTGRKCVSECAPCMSVADKQHEWPEGPGSRGVKSNQRLAGSSLC